MITKQEQAIYPTLGGYFGHVVEVGTFERGLLHGHGPLLWVQFQGRVGGEVDPVFMRGPWTCWSDEVEHVD